MSKKNIILLILLLSSFFHSTLPFSKKATSTEVKKLATTTHTYNSYNSELIKNVATIGIVLLSAMLAISSLWLLQNQKEFGKDFHKALLRGINNPASDHLASLQEARKEVSEFTLNDATLEEDSTPLEYAVKKVNQVNQLDEGHLKVLSILIDPNKATYTSIRISEATFYSLLEVVLKRIESPNSFQILQGAFRKGLKSTSYNLLTKLHKLVDENTTAFDLLLGYYFFHIIEEIPIDYRDQFQHAQKAFYTFLDNNNNLPKQLEPTSEGLKRALKLAILKEESYKNNLIEILDQASSELINTSLFPLSEFINIETESDFFFTTELDKKVPLIEIVIRLLANQMLSAPKKEILHQTIKHLLEKKSNVVPSLRSIKYVIQSYKNNLHDVTKCFSLMRQKATPEVLNEAFIHLLERLEHVDSLQVKSPLAILLNSKNSKHTLQINAKILVTMLSVFQYNSRKKAHQTTIDTIFEKLDFAPNLLEEKVNGYLLQEHLTNMLATLFYKMSLYILEKLFLEKKYKEKLFPPNQHGLTIALLAVIKGGKYQEDLKKIIDRIDDHTLDQPLLLLEQENSSNPLAYSIQEYNSKALTSILSKDSYRKKLLTDNIEGFKRAVEIAIVTEGEIRNYSNELLSIYKNKLTWFDEKIFDPYKKEKMNLLDYALEARNQLLLDFLFSNLDYQKKIGTDHSVKNLERVVSIAIINQKKYLPFLEKILPHIDQIIDKNPENKLLKKKLLENAIDQVAPKVVELLLTNQNSIEATTLELALKNVIRAEKKKEAKTLEANNKIKQNQENSLAIFKKVINKIDEKILKKTILSTGKNLLEYAIISGASKELVAIIKAKFPS